MTGLDHVRTFEHAWNDPANTRYALPPVDVNAMLTERYELGTPLLFTRAMLWDNEVRKARRPDLFLPWVVEPGSARAWGAADTFVRSSRQRRWTKPDVFGSVLEQTYLDHERQAVTFIGTSMHPGPTGEMLYAADDQPIFHVEHSVSGDETRPINEWRIVHLTSEPDPEITAVFDRMAGTTWLPDFIEIYVGDVLGVALTRR